MIALPEMVNNPTVRYLLDLEVLGVEVFPNSDHGYFLTDLGRYLLSNKMGFKLLYPEILCELLKVGFWQSHNGFEREKVTFKRKYNISWDRGVDLLVNALREKK